MKLTAILGPAGTGKTTRIRALDPATVTMTATTGSAAVNMGQGVTTVNSALGFFGEIRDSQIYPMAGKITKLMQGGCTTLVIDEISMMDAHTLDAVVRAVEIANVGTHGNYLDLVVTGDFCQLPPVKGRFAFMADAWKRFHVETLRTVYRQTDPAMLEALESARKGRGPDTVLKLQKAGVQFADKRDEQFEGVTVAPTNATADTMNTARFLQILAPSTGYKSFARGVQKSEWAHIPNELFLKVGARVMILANEPGTFGYVNGDQGTVVELGEKTVTVDVERINGADLEVFAVDIPYITRENTSPEKPPSGQALWDEKRERWVLGSITYMPLRLGWATTVHKSQGLTLDRVQIDARQSWIDPNGRHCGAGSPGMQYVALSRCRNPQGIRIVSSLADYAKRVRTSAEVAQWV